MQQQLDGRIGRSLVSWWAYCEDFILTRSHCIDEAPLPICVPCSDLIDLINGPQSKNDRKKLITLCTVDVHARDVVQRMIEERVEGGQCFQWQSQMRYQQNDKTKECQVRIAMPCWKCCLSAPL